MAMHFFVALRNALHPVALRRSVVLRPLKVTIQNLADGEIIKLTAHNHPEDMEMGTREIEFSKELYIDELDFMIEAPSKYHRLAPNKEVRLKYGFWIRCIDYKTNMEGKVIEVVCTYDPETAGGFAPKDGRKVKGTIHWVSASNAIDVQVKMFDTLFTTPTLDDIPERGTWRDLINKNSLNVYNAKAEPDLRSSTHPYLGGASYQFERTGFFVADYKTTDKLPQFNLTVSLTDTWAAQSNETSKEAMEKEAAKLAREKAVQERQKKKEERERKALEKAAAKSNC